jgi:hypothetical protein
MKNQTPISCECRRRPAIDHNYSLVMPCAFRAYTDGELIQEGAGETVRMSSKVVLFRPARFIPAQATELSVSVAWPVTLEDGTALQLVFSGRPYWERGVFAGIEIERYQFRTRRSAALGNSLPLQPVAIPRVFEARGAGVWVSAGV